MRPTGNTFNATGVPVQHSPWHSPVPYLFGGLAAMLGLIAFALLILACSYWRLSGYMDNNENNEREGQSSDEKPSDAMKIPQNLEVVVIMAGEEKPTYLATPISSRASSFGDKKENGKMETQKEEGDGRNEETQDQNP